MYFLLLPINSLRLFQIIKLVKKARSRRKATCRSTGSSRSWTRAPTKKATCCFAKAKTADEMFLITTGKFLVKEIGIELPPGRLMGELGFVTPNNKRTQTVECIEDGAVMTITYDRLLEVYFEQSGLRLFFPAPVERPPAAEHGAHGSDHRDYKLKLQAATAANSAKPA